VAVALHLFFLNRRVTDMPDFRAVHLDIIESTLQIEGELRITVFAAYGGQAEKTSKELTLYRPLPYAKDDEWLKDVLVQVIEQL
jgi:hypothetical protein